MGERFPSFYHMFIVLQPFSRTPPTDTLKPASLQQLESFRRRYTSETIQHYPYGKGSMYIEEVGERGPPSV